MLHTGQTTAQPASSPSPRGSPARSRLLETRSPPAGGPVKTQRGYFPALLGAVTHFVTLWAGEAAPGLSSAGREATSCPRSMGGEVQRGKYERSRALEQARLEHRAAAGLEPRRGVPPGQPEHRHGGGVTPKTAAKTTGKLLPTAQRGCNVQSEALQAGSGKKKHFGSPQDGEGPPCEVLAGG